MNPLEIGYEVGFGIDIWRLTLILAIMLSIQNLKEKKYPTAPSANRFIIWG